MTNCWMNETNYKTKGNINVRTKEQTSVYKGWGAILLLHC